jgi:hypothetical protein
MEAPKTPMHPFEVRISIGGDDWDYILRAVADIAKHFIERGPDHIGLCSGGGAVRATVIQHRPVPQARQPGEVPAGARRSGTRPCRADTRRAVGLLRSGPSSRARPAGCNTSTRSTLSVWQMMENGFGR